MQRLWGLAILATMLVGAAAAQQPPIGPGAPGKPSCYEIHSAVPFTILTHVMLPSRVTSVARIEPNTAQRHCIEGALFPDSRVNFRIVSGLGPPLFSCQTRIDKPIFVSANKDPQGGYTYQVTCY
ncbi:MAG TPA: hypothetical protein VMQ11_18705 [Alphaproteobacteria bacterium]|nr:hypothetical protein [Alphaproteobacteria bacterium]